MSTVYLQENCTVEQLIRVLEGINPKLMVLLSESPATESCGEYINRCSPIRMVDVGVQNLARQSHNILKPKDSQLIDSVCLFPCD